MNMRLLDPTLFERVWQTSSADFQTDREFRRGLPSVEMETIYLGRGQKPGRNAAWAVGQDVSFVRYIMHDETTTNIVPDPDWGMLTLPIALNDTARINGFEFGTHDIICWYRNDGYSSYCKRRDVITVWHRKAQLCATLSAQAGTEFDPLMLPSDVRTIEPKIKNAMMVRLLALLRASFQRPLGMGMFALTDYQQARIIDGIARFILHDPLNEVRLRQAASTSLKVVQKAMTAFVDHDRPPTVSDLCAASGVGDTWLHRCFQEVCGLSPAQYLLERRLSAARERLLDREVPARSVKDVALALGFEGPGRFAQYYKRTFGELPSETFQRSGARR